ncbi:amidohydrolase family protein [Microbispora sp. H10670]|uniref:amidohydrolase family protein n=1 Tax=Microbispora sp. H10670 TaxID=2729108 RepID=UPI00160295D0|nr:amidohydrolase family protein [Microbispora sp. H10670]
MDPSSDQRFLRAARVYPALGDDVLHDAVVEMRGDRVVRVCTAADAAADLARPGARVIDYGDATVVPGLVDAHCHITLTGDGTPYERQVLDSDEMMALIAVSNLQRHLASGVTTIRDNGGRNRIVFEVRGAVERGYVRGPRMLLAGRPITHSYGHFYWCNGVADGADQIRAAVRRLVAEGADHIKIMASGGATAGNIPYYSSYTAAEMRVAVETAHGLGRLTTAHCRATSSMLNAVEAGLDCIEHGEFLVPGEMMEFGGGVASSGRMVYDPAVAQTVHDAGTFISFTAQTGGWETLVDLRRRAEHGPLGDVEKGRVSAIEAYFDMKLGILSSMLADGLGPRIAISSDAGPYDVAFGGLQHGIELAVAAGLTPLAAIRAATAVAAEACGIADQVGALAPGRLADLLVVGGDATRDVSRLWDVRAVYQSGRLVAPLVADSGADTGVVPLLPVRPAAAVPDC